MKASELKNISESLINTFYDAGRISIELYKKGLFIDIKAVQKSRVEQNVNKTKSKTTKRKRRKSS